MTLPNPESRKEAYLAKASGMAVENLPEPASREEQYLNAIAEGGGGGGYVLPVASASTLGGVKVGENLTINAEGILSAIGGGGGSTIARTLTEDDLVNGNFELFGLPSGVYVVPKMENVKVYTDDQHNYWTNNQLAIVSNNESSLTADIIFLSQDFGAWLLNVSTAGGYAYSRGTIATSTDISALEARISALEGGSAPSPSYPYTSDNRTYYLYNGVEVYVNQTDASQTLYYASNNTVAIQGGEWGDNGDGTVSYIGGGNSPAPEEPVSPDEPVAPEDAETPAEG